MTESSREELIGQHLEDGDSDMFVLGNRRISHDIQKSHSRLSKLRSKSEMMGKKRSPPPPYPMIEQVKEIDDPENLFGAYRKRHKCLFLMGMMFTIASQIFEASLPILVGQLIHIVS